jgi:hypothetical protein
VWVIFWGLVIERLKTIVAFRGHMPGGRSLFT